MTEQPIVLFEAQNLTKRFGGLAAVNGLNLKLWQGCIHAVIGPNGAGKSTLTNLLSGDLPATSGSVFLMNDVDQSRLNITGWSSEKIARYGVGRSFQKTNIFASFSVWDNVLLAAQSREQPNPFNPTAWFRQVSQLKSARARAERAVELTGLQNRLNTLAAEASHGEQRQLEIAMALATEPRVLLLDEPLAGMGVKEAERMVELLQSLKSNHAMLLVEHDMDAVFSLADHLTVMVNGEVIASDTPAAVRSNAAVQAAYLGEGEHA